MLKITTVEFFTRAIPEMLIFVWGIYVVSNQQFDKKKYLMSSIIMAIIAFLVRMLPIHYGIHTIIDDAFFIVINIVVINISLVKAIYSTFFISILLGLSEFINVILLNKLNIEINDVVKNPIKKSMLGVPSLVIFVFLIFLIISFLKRRKV